MSALEIKYKPINKDEWLPDRCLSFLKPLYVSDIVPEGGCPSFSLSYTNGDRKLLEKLYHEALTRYGCCGYVAWNGDNVVGHHTFFPFVLAREIRFYGWRDNEQPIYTETLVHNCISLINDSKYRRKGIGSNLVRKSLKWAKLAGWKRFEVHKVLPDNGKAYSSEQKSCVTFWKKLGFSIFRSSKAADELMKLYDVSQVYSMFLDL
ncbi:MAG: GNAT family N-acetyltransferase [Candidatus Heimdallarchaeota archaeon]